MNRFVRMYIVTSLPSVSKTRFLFLSVVRISIVHGLRSNGNVGIREERDAHELWYTSSVFPGNLVSTLDFHFSFSSSHKSPPVSLEVTSYPFGVRLSVCISSISIYTPDITSCITSISIRKPPGTCLCPPTLPATADKPRLL